MTQWLTFKNIIFFIYMSLKFILYMKAYKIICSEVRPDLKAHTRYIFYKMNCIMSMVHIYNLRNNKLFKEHLDLLFQNMSGFCLFCLFVIVYSFSEKVLRTLFVPNYVKCCPVINKIMKRWRKRKRKSSDDHRSFNPFDTYNLRVLEPWSHRLELKKSNGL